MEIRIVRRYTASFVVHVEFDPAFVETVFDDIELLQSASDRWTRSLEASATTVRDRIQSNLENFHGVLSASVEEV